MSGITRSAYRSKNIGGNTVKWIRCLKFFSNYTYTSTASVPKAGTIPRPLNGGGETEGKRRITKEEENKKKKVEFRRS